MNKLLYQELLKLEKQIERHIARTKAEMDNDPISALIEVHLKFHDFIAEMQGKPGARTGTDAMAKIDALIREKDRQEERRNTWDWDKLCQTHIEWGQALGELEMLLWQHRREAAQVKVARWLRVRWIRQQAADPVRVGGGLRSGPGC